jgi:hypothetical protein
LVLWRTQKQNKTKTNQTKNPEHVAPASKQDGEETSMNNLRTRQSKL